MKIILIWLQNGVMLRRYFIRLQHLIHSLTISDVPQSVHIEATLRLADFQHKAVRSTSKSAIKSIIALQKSVDRDEHRTKKPYDLAQKKYKYQKKYNLLASSMFKQWVTLQFV